MRKILILLTFIMCQFLFVGYLPHAHGGECVEKAHTSRILNFKIGGKPLEAKTLEELKKSFPSHTITVFEEESGKTEKFKGFKLYDLITKIYGVGLADYEDVLFEATDGYKPSIPMETLKNLPAYLAYGYGNEGKIFVMEKNALTGEQCVPLGPFYLVWDNLSRPELFKNEKLVSWPYQVEAMSLINFKKQYAELVPPLESPLNVQSGFAAFKRYCLKCHSLNGMGGDKAPGLEGATKRFSVEKLKKILSDPKSLNPETTKFIPFREEGKEKEEIIKDVIFYLRFMDGVDKTRGK